MTRRLPDAVRTAVRKLVQEAEANNEILDAYGMADDAMIRRARGWAVLRSLVLISIGQTWAQGLPGGKQSWGPAGQAALERVLAAA